MLGRARSLEFSPIVLLFIKDLISGIIAIVTTIIIIIIIIFIYIYI